MLAAGLLLPQLRAADPAGIFIEAEQFTRRSPNDGSFAAPLKSESAHGGAGLTRFFLPGYVTYVFAVRTAGTYDLWVRYVSNQNQSLRYNLDGPGEGERAKATIAPLQSTGGLEGPDVWQWARVVQARLSAGAHTLTVHSAPLRLDCFWLGTGDQPPPVVKHEGRSLAVTRQHLINPIEPVTPDWLAGADDYRLPGWYDSIRVCAHTRLSWPMRPRLPETFAHAGQMLAAIGFKEIARHIRGGGEPAWWPSAVGAVEPEAQGVNLAQQLIDEAHASGCRIMVYSRHMEDEFMARQHPDWAALDARGKPIVKRGPMLCLNSPFADFMQTRLLELARMGADGLYFDEVHLAKPICYCPRCREGFEKVTGLKYPAGNDPSDPLFQKAIEYRNTIIERVFLTWRAALHRVNPECVMLIGSNTYPAMNDRHTTQRLWRVADAMKSEFNLPARTGNNRIFTTDPSLALPETDARVALGYTLNRDACDGRPPHVWAHGIPDATQMMFATAGMIAHGQIANLDNPEAGIPDPALFGPAVELGNRVAPAFAGTRPRRWAAVHFSEVARDYYLPDEAQAWKQVLYPVYGAFTTLLRAHLPVGIVTDSQLEQGRLDDYRVLFLPAPRQLTDRMRQAVEAFKRRGGLVVEQQAGWEWHRREGGMKEGSASFLAAIGAAVRLAPVQAVGGPDKMHVVPFQSPDGKRLTISLVNDFCWVQTGTAKKPASKQQAAKGSPGRKTKKSVSGEGENEGTIGPAARVAPPPCQGVQLFVRTPGRVIDVRDQVTGQSLQPVRQAGGFRLDLPAFDCLSVVVVELAR